MDPKPPRGEEILYERAGNAIRRVYPSPHAGLAAADFPLIAVGVLEKHGVVARRVFVAILRAFDVLRAGLADDRAEAVDFFFRVRPEGEAVGVASIRQSSVESKSSLLPTIFRLPATMNRGRCLSSSVTGEALLSTVTAVSTVTKIERH